MLKNNYITTTMTRKNSGIQLKQLGTQIKIIKQGACATPRRASEIAGDIMDIFVIY